MKSIDVLKLKFYSNDLNKEVTVKEYLKELLSVLWNEKDGFSGKRPFGNSDWQYELYTCLVKNDVVKGKIDVEYLIDFDYESAEAEIKNAIQKI